MKIAAVAVAVPIEGDNMQDMFDLVPEDDVHFRVRRATCDLIGGGIGDSLCAAHCLAKGYRGGYCNNKRVCVCRN
ncbi:defensin-like isoform X2 [Odontomachus brunneus]|uniref:defensin-like isoform X2 n=1 Tax=Odontomachus brunneus TaxID=486640 RepID=UPI0013F19427|nr:defensin-like isoform X2 [Odontomachus brunneus]